MSHFGHSGTVLDTPNTLVSILNLTTIYCASPYSPYTSAHASGSGTQERQGTYQNRGHTQNTAS